MKLITSVGFLLSFAFGSVNLTPLLEYRIVGGKNTTIEEYPYQLYLWKSGRLVCGASLLRPNIALIAAQCHIVVPPPFKVQAGSTKRTSGGILVDVVDYCPHPEFNKESPLDYDVSVILLNESLSLGPKIQTIALQEAGEEVKDGTVATLTGWGRLSENRQDADILQEVQIPKVNVDVCKKENAKILTVTDRMDCYGYEAGGKGPCLGDGGSPLVVNHKQVGIASWGHGCGRPKYPAGFTKIGNKEIHEHIEKCIKKFSSL